MLTTLQISLCDGLQRKRIVLVPGLQFSQGRDGIAYTPSLDVCIHGLQAVLDGRLIHVEQNGGKRLILQTVIRARSRTRITVGEIRNPRLR